MQLSTAECSRCTVMLDVVEYDSVIVRRGFVSRCDSCVRCFCCVGNVERNIDLYSECEGK